MCEARFQRDEAARPCRSFVGKHEPQRRVPRDNPCVNGSTSDQIRMSPGPRGA
jgi:hypothetical protein